jgi:hypothetical protein
MPRGGGPVLTFGMDSSLGRSLGASGARGGFSDRAIHTIGIETILAENGAMSSNQRVGGGVVPKSRWRQGVNQRG